MRIAYFLEYPLASQGGVSVLVRTLIENLGDEFEVILVSPDTVQSLEQCPGANRLLRHIPWPAVRQAPSREFREAAKHVVDEISDLEVDLCHFHCGGAFGWGNRWPGSCIPAMLKKLGVPSIWTNHLVVGLLHGYCGPEKPLWFKLSMLPMAWLGKAQQLAAVKAEICVSDHDAKKMRRWYFPFRKKIHRIYHSRIKVNAEWAMADSEERRPVILSVGHIAWRKGQHILAEAFAMIAKDHPEWELHIAGHVVEDRCAARIVHIAKNYGLNARFRLLGSVNDPSKLMKCCSIFVQPSMFEGLPLALQEAMSNAIPIIASAIPCHRELIEDKSNGFLFKPNDSIQLAQLLNKFILSPNSRYDLATNAMSTINTKGINVSKMVAKHEDLYNKFC